MKRHSRAATAHLAFTLIELLVVMPSSPFSSACWCPPCKKSARPPTGLTVRNNLHQLGIALNNYESANKFFRRPEKAMAGASTPKSLAIASIFNLKRPGLVAPLSGAKRHGQQHQPQGRHQ